jgi:sortase A
MVREGTDSITLRRAAGHLPGTALPGERGNAVVAGHRDRFFRPLRHIKRGETIVFITRQGRFQYTVASLRVVSPDAVSVVRASPEPTCTLITCFPFDYIGPAKRRFVVEARLVQ